MTFFAVLVVVGKWTLAAGGLVVFYQLRPLACAIKF